MAATPATSMGSAVAFRQVPKVTSSPPDPSAPSLLTKLPPEIRNPIYELLFACEGLVLLHDAKGCYLREDSVREELQSRSRYEKEKVMYQEEYQVIVGRDSTFFHRFRDGLGLLKSCRQCYWEVAALWYGNAFLFSRAFTCGRECSLGDWGCHIAYAERWISGLGSQSLLLRRVFIDADAICHTLCHKSGLWLDMLPLLRLMNANSTSTIEVEFLSTDRKWLCDTKLSRAKGVERKWNQAARLNGIIQELGRKDVLNLKRYLPFSKLLEQVCISRCGPEGHVRYYPTRPADFRPKNDFAITADSELVQIKATKEALGL